MRLFFLGSSNAQKPMIILKTLADQHFDLRNAVYITDDDAGICVDFCAANQISVLQYDEKEIIEFTKRITEKKLLISIGWPKLIDKNILQVWDAAINCHGSILPDYRGSRSYMHYWANLAPEYGATIHYMNDRFDDGNIILQGKLKAYMEETQHIMHRRTAELCGYLLPTAINLVKNGFEGYVAEGKKRYFYQMTPSEFELHRKINVERVSKGEPAILTKHKELL